MSLHSFIQAVIIVANIIIGDHKFGSSLAEFSGHISFGTVLKNIFFFLNQHLQIGRFHIKMCISSLWKIWEMCSLGPGFMAAPSAGRGYRACAHPPPFAPLTDSPRQPSADYR